MKQRDDLGPVGVLIHMRLGTMFELLEIGNNKHKESELVGASYSYKTLQEALHQSQYCNVFSQHLHVPTSQEGFSYFVAQMLLIVVHVH